MCRCRASGSGFKVFGLQGLGPKMPCSVWKAKVEGLLTWTEPWAKWFRGFGVEGPRIKS